MRRQTASRPSLYDQLLALPEGLIGEIIDGQLRTQPRPSGPHALASSRLGADIEGPYSRGRGGPGGWWIIDEPEIHFVLDIEVVVPDIAGWLQARLPSLPHGHRFKVVPDWICEIFSPATKSSDREEKMPLYARYRVPFAWLVDPSAHTLEAYRLIEGKWAPVGLYRDDDQVRVAPFEAITLRLAELWA
jgi:Uma2 family endonuclease